MTEAWVGLETAQGPFRVAATVTLPGVGEFNPEPDFGPVWATFHGVPPITVPRQLDAQTFERWDWMLILQRKDVPGLRHGAVIEATAPGEATAERWFVDEVQDTGGDEVRALVKAMPEEA